MIEWKIILITFFSTTSIATGIIFLLKKGIEKSIDLKFSQAELKTKLELEELKRRQSKLFDKVFEAEKILLSSIYESRNLIKYDLLGSINDENFQFSQQLIIKLNDKLRDISGILINEKIILPDDVFKLSHDYKHKLMDLHHLIDISIVNTQQKVDNNEKIKQIANEIDSIYDLLSSTIKKHYDAIKSD